MLKSFNNNVYKLTVYGSADMPFFKGAEVAGILGYKKPNKAILTHVDDDDKLNFADLTKKEGVPKWYTVKVDPQTIFINESGLYSLILSSKLPSAKQFKKWITTEVLPSIRKSGEYKLNTNVKAKVATILMTEADLQKAVVNHLRVRYPDVYFTASLGELQDTSEKRINSAAMGYTKGTPDLFIFHRNRKYTGLAIEFKTPKGNGQLSPEQEQRLKCLQTQKWDVLVSNDICEIVERIYQHINQNKVPKNVKKIMVP